MQIDLPSACQSPMGIQREVSLHLLSIRVSR